MSRSQSLFVRAQQTSELSTTAVSRRLLLLEAVLVAVVLAGLAGHLCLISSPMPTGYDLETVRPWNGSWLEPVVRVLALDFSTPTLKRVEIKPLFLRLTAVLALLLAVLRYGLDSTRSAPVFWFWRWRKEPAVSVGALLVLGWLWTVISSRWAVRTDLAVSTASAEAFPLLLALAIGVGLTPRSLRWLLVGTISIVTGSAALGLWYYLVRNPDPRLGFPVGNPLHLAAVLMVSLLFAAGLVLDGQCRQRLERPPALRWAGKRFALYAAILVLCIALWATDARAAAIGLLTGILIVPWCFAGRRLRWTLAGGGALLLVLDFFALRFAGQEKIYSSMARSESLTHRRILAEYAGTVWQQHPLTGSGPAGFLLQFARLNQEDKHKYPLVFAGDFEFHCHSEPLQRLAEQGPLGLLFYLLPVLAVLLVVRPEEGKKEDWVWVASTAAVVGLWVESCFTPTLYGPGTPFVWVVAWGAWLVSARNNHSADVLPASLTIRTKLWKLAALGTSLALAGWGTVIAWADWQGARADYQAALAASAGRWEEARTLYEQAAATRLEPAQQLRAQLDALRMELAELDLLRNQLVQWHLQNPPAATQPGPVLMDLGRQYLQRLERLSAEIAALQQVAPGTLSLPKLQVGVLEQQLCLAQEEGNAPAIARTRAGWQEAIQAAWQNDPADLRLVASLVFSRHSPIQAPEDKLMVLASPLTAGWPDLSSYPPLLRAALLRPEIKAACENMVFDSGNFSYFLPCTEREAWPHSSPFQGEGDERSEPGEGEEKRRNAETPIRQNQKTKEPYPHPALPLKGGGVASFPSKTLDVASQLSAETAKPALFPPLASPNHLQMERLGGYVSALLGRYDLAVKWADDSARQLENTPYQSSLSAAWTEAALWRTFLADNPQRREEIQRCLHQARTTMPGLGLAGERRKREVMESLIAYLLDGPEAAVAAAPAWRIRTEGREKWLKHIQALANLLRPVSTSQPKP